MVEAIGDFLDSSEMMEVKMSQREHNRITKLRFSLIYIFLMLYLLPIYARGDVPIQLTPSPDQINSNEACRIAGSLFSEVTGIDEYEFSQCKYLWLSLSDRSNIIFFDTIIPTPNGYWYVELTHVWNSYRLRMFIDAKSGKVLLWQIEDHRDQNSVVVYENAYPANTEIDWLQAGKTAETWIKSVIDLDDRGLSFIGFTAAYVSNTDSSLEESGQWIISKTYIIKGENNLGNSLSDREIIDSYQYLACIVNVSAMNNQIVYGKVSIEENYLYEDGDVDSVVLFCVEYDE